MSPRRSRLQDGLWTTVGGIDINILFLSLASFQDVLLLTSSPVSVSKARDHRTLWLLPLSYSSLQNSQPAHALINTT